MDVKAILKNGERIAMMNVLRIGTEKIECIQSSPIGVENKKVRKKIVINDIESIDEWDSTAFNTGGGVNTIVVENISFMHKDLAAIKIQSSKGSRAFGSVLMGYAARKQ